jgi:hypothetical protein
MSGLSFFVIPANAGIHGYGPAEAMDSRVRGNDA